MKALDINAASVRKLGITVAAFIPFTAVLTYLALTTPTGLRQPPAASDAAPAPPQGHTPADLDRMIDHLQADLAAHPRNLEGWVLLGRSFAAAGRWEEARNAFVQALAQRPDDRDLHLQLGEVLVLAAQGTVTPDAAREFAHAPDDPRARYYAAVALAQAGQLDQARQQLRALAAEAPPDAPWLSLVRTELATLDDGARAPLRSPIQHLAERVRADPHDAESWLGLARAYQDAGDRPHALETLAQANAQNPDNLNLLLANAALLADDIKDDRLPPPFLAVLRRVAAIDPDQPDALWYLGLDAAARGDSKDAARLWQHLLIQLPPGDDERAAVQRQLKLLH